MQDYRVQLSTSPSFSSVLVDRYTNSDLGTEEFTATDGVEYGHSYYFRVKARDNAGNESAWSVSSDGIYVREDPRGPTIAHAPIASTFYGQNVVVEATTECRSSSGCQAYLLYRQTSTEDGPVSEVLGTGTTFTRTPMVKGTVQDLGDHDLVAWSASIPGSVVTTLGVDYLLEAEEEHGTSAYPGAPYLGLDTGSGDVVIDGEGSYFHITTLSPPLPAHQPPPFAAAGQSLPLTLRVSCSTGDCDATMFFRSTASQVTEDDFSAWPSVAMTPSASPQALGDAGELLTFMAEIPADYVDTRGVDYAFRVDDGHTQAWSPGTTYQGYYVPTDGARVGYFHVRVLEPPHVAHVPVAASSFGAPIAIEATGTCVSIQTCEAILHYRTTTSDVLDFDAPFVSAPMAVSIVEQVDGQDVVLIEGEVSGAAADTRGVDYWISLSDGDTTGYWPGTSVNDGYLFEGVQVGYHHVRVLEPPHFLHSPIPATPALEDYEVTTEITCATPECEVTLYYSNAPNGPTGFEEVVMSLDGTSNVGDQRIETWSATIPASDVTTRGLAYFMRASDGYTATYGPGTFYWGAYVPTDGTPISGVEAGIDGDSGPYVDSSATAVMAFPVRVLEPPHVVHQPPAVIDPEENLEITALSTCSTQSCEASLIYWVEGEAVVDVAMASQTETNLVLNAEVWSYSSSIPGDSIASKAVWYRIEVSDGYANMSTPTHLVNPTTSGDTPVPTSPPTEDCTTDVGSDTDEDPVELPICEITDSSDPAIVLPTTPDRQVLVISANATQAYAQDSDACPSSPPAPGSDAYKSVKACDSELREKKLAKRVKALAKKELGEEIDGMGYVPDVILLQEVRKRTDAKDIAAYLNGLIRIKQGSKKLNPQYTIAKGRQDPVIYEDSDRVTKVDSAILYSQRTMKRPDKDKGFSVTTKYESADACTNSTGLLLDLDGDGQDDCEKVKWKRHYLISLKEKSSGELHAVASVHFITRSHLKDYATHSARMVDWVGQVADKLTDKYPDAANHFIGGDLNATRCVRPQDEMIPIPEDSREGKVCSERLWWTTLTRERGYVDTVYFTHGTTQAGLDAQYEDGDTRREKRIDYIFSVSVNAAGRPVPSAASHDLTCGASGPANNKNCNNLDNPDRYADHRLLWSLV